MSKHNKNLMSYFVRKQWSLITFGVMLLVGLYLRIGGVLANSFAFTYDVGRDMLQLSQIANHKIPLIGPTTGLAGLFYGPWWYYILTPSFIISGGNPQGVALFMVLAGLATVVLGFFLGKRIGGKILGLIIASFLAISDAMVSSSSQIWNPNLAPLLVILVFFVLLGLLKTKKRFLLFGILGFLLGLMLDTEIVFGVLFGGGVVLSLIYLFRRKIFQLPILGLFIGFFVILFPRIFFELRHNFVMTKSFFTTHVSSQQIFNLKDFFLVLPDRITTFLSQIADTFGFGNPAYGFFLLVAVIVVCMVLWKKLQEMERFFIITSAIILSTFLIGSAVFARALWGHYLVGLPVLYIFIVSVALVLICRKFLVWGILCILVLCILTSKPGQIISNMQNPHWEGNAAVYRNQVAVIDYIYKQAKNRSFNEIVYTPVVHDYTYRYLFSWYGENTYGYIPSKDTKKLLYVIIEPDPGYEGRITDWLKIREGDGKVINQKTVKGGIIVQTRIR